MRILANYGYKTNGDSYSVTFETMGDVPKEQADGVVDGLFALAKSAVQRQVNPEVRLDDPRGIATPESTKHANGNGKPVIKDPLAPASSKQKQFIVKLAKEKGRWIKGLREMTMGEANKIIEDLLVVEV